SVQLRPVEQPTEVIPRPLRIPRGGLRLFRSPKGHWSITVNAKNLLLTVEVLKTAKDLLTTKGHTKGYYAKNERGASGPSDAPERTAGEVVHAFSLAIQLAEKDLAAEQPEATCLAECRPFAHTETCA